MADPLHDLYQRLSNPRERTVSGQFAEGRAWACERARVLCNYKLTHHFEWFNFYLAVVKQYSAANALKVSEDEARLVRESCAHVLTNCIGKLMERLRFRAKCSIHAREIAGGVKVLETALNGISDDNLTLLQSLYTSIRDEEKNGTPVSMGGKWLPIPAPATAAWVAKSRQREKANTMAKTRSTRMRAKRSKKTHKVRQ